MRVCEGGGEGGVGGMNSGMNSALVFFCGKNCGRDVGTLLPSLACAHNGNADGVELVSAA